MNDHAEPGLAIRTAVAADLPALQQVYRAASLSNAGDAPMLLARPEFLVFTREGIAGGRTLVASPPGTDRVIGFATVAAGQDDGPPRPRCGGVQLRRSGARQGGRPRG